MMRQRLHFVLLVSHFLLAVATNTSEECEMNFVVNPLQGKQHYVVGVLANRGADRAFAEFNETFSDYLTDRVGPRFAPKVSFSMRAMGFNDIRQYVVDGSVDLICVNPAAFSCVDSEFGAASLATLKRYITIDGTTHVVDAFGGVIIARKDRDDIASVADIRGKTYATASISGLGSGQAQFRELYRRGISFVQDVEQAIFTSNQNDVVRLVESRAVDVGFVRENQLPKMAAAGDIDPDDFKFLDARYHEYNGGLYPYALTTDLFPEWNVAALSSVDDAVRKEIALALLEMDEGHPASAGRYHSWGATQPYMQLRNMQSELGYIRRDPVTQRMQCMWGGSLYDAIACPDGYFRSTEAQVLSGCEQAGRVCPEGFQCLCKPCQLGANIELIPMQHYPDRSERCDRMSQCEEVEQLAVTEWVLIDHLKRPTLEITAQIDNPWRTRQNALHQSEEDDDDEEEEEEELPRLAVVSTPRGDAEHEYIVRLPPMAEEGLHVVELLLDGLHIDSSPVFFSIVPRNCDRDYPNAGKVPNAAGDCTCDGESVQIGSSCVLARTIAMATLLPLLLVLFCLLLFFIRRRRKAADSLWLVRHSDVHYSKPIEVIGRTSAGFVVKAEYRGTPVAVKRIRIEGRTTELNRPPSIRSGEEFASEDAEQRGSQEDPLSGNGTATPTAADSASTRPLARRASISGVTSAEQLFAATPGADAATAKPRSWLWKWCEWSELPAELAEQIRALSRVRHPCITTVIGAVVEKGIAPLLLMEMMNHGSLYDMLRNCTVALDGDITLPIMRDVAQGLLFLHSGEPPIVHAALRSQHILIDASFHAKVTGFGMRKRSKTPMYTAPELLRGGDSTPSSDVYAFAILLCEIVAREDPYGGEEHAEIRRRVVEEELRPRVSGSCTDDLKILIHECWQSDPALRPPTAEVSRRLRNFSSSKVSPVAQVMNGRRQKEQQLNTILYDVFPRKVADALAEGRKVEPEARESVTIFFSDIVGFTTISSSVAPAKISHMLGRLYTAFDALSREHGVFKVETIGDAYMAVTNMVEDQPQDHVARLARFALAAVEAAAKTPIDEDDEAAGFVKIRVGMHSGPVVADVVGTRNPRYCLFGDTVNTASRMESTSVEGRIQLSSQSARLLRQQAPAMHMRMRGVIEVKGKGKMRTFWLVRNDDDVPSSSQSDVETRRVLDKDWRSERNMLLSESSGHSRLPSAGSEQPPPHGSPLLPSVTGSDHDGFPSRLPPMAIPELEPAASLADVTAFPNLNGPARARATAESEVTVRVDIDPGKKTDRVTVNGELAIASGASGSPLAASSPLAA